MTTLTTKDGIEWMCLKHNGKLAFGHNRFAIHFEDGFFHLKESGESRFIGLDAVECLEAAPQVMLDCYAEQFKPIWEQ